MNPSGGITSPTKHPTDPLSPGESGLPPESGCSLDGGGVSRGKNAVQASTNPKNPEFSTNFGVTIKCSDPSFPKNGSSSRRFSPYGSNNGSGALRGKGKGMNRKEKGQNKYSPMLSELKVNEFIQGTSAMGVRRTGEESSETIGLNPLVNGPTDDDSAGLPPIGEATVMDTEMDGLQHTLRPANLQVTDEDYGMFSPRKDCNDTQSIVWDASMGHYNLSGGNQGYDLAPKKSELKSNLDNHQKANSVWTSPVSGFESFAEKIKKSNEISACNQPLESPPSPALETGTAGLNTPTTVIRNSGPSVDKDGFTAVTRRKKMGPIKMQGKKQKPVKLKATFQHFDHVRPVGRQVPADQDVNQLGKAPHVNKDAIMQGVLKPTSGISNATKKGSSGFNFTRAVQGDRGGKNIQQPSTTMASPHKSSDVDTSNRFAVLDIPNSIKFNKVIEIQDDLYPLDLNAEVGMDLDMTRSNVGQSLVGQPSQLGGGDHGLPPDILPVCQVNREFREGVRILPSSIVTPPKESQQPFGHEVSSTHLIREDNEEKDYGISNAQKMAISSRLRGPAQAVRAADMDMWEQGEHAFFEDQVKALGLDYDYCIEDVDSDEENGTAQFFAAQMKVGMPKVPIPTLSQMSK
ncbi:hypothetical protein L1987_73052 [Smallanthus sonchifolius]|uniref:Uncharacterized protein n=1 Tax=Smallanthus sonchifolius TaxID=185202 RepID=A0ACB9AXT6_9ASTR|nr:hypothetical protein L1987_73052 [Smallanthus sonchifolius]